MARRKYDVDTGTNAKNEANDIDEDGADDGDDVERGVIGGNKLNTKRKVMLNYVMMASAFSINHGVATTLIALASSEFETSLAAYSLATLYGLYTLTALFVATAVVSKLGPKYSLCVGAFGYCFYISTFLVASVTTGNVRTALVILGSAISGIGAGLLWTAQGQYFEASVRLYAKATGERHKQVSGLLAGIFTGMYMGLEFCLKLLSSLVELEAHKQLIFGLFITIAFSSSVLMLFIKNIRPKQKPNDASHSNGRLVADKAMAAINLLRREKNALLLAPYNFAFGFSSYMLGFYANKYIVTDQLQPADSSRSYVGYAASIAIFSGTFASLFFGFLTKKIGKTFPMVLGNLCFLVMATCFAFIPEQTLGSWSWVVPLYITYGVGRGIWESTNRAIYGEFFPDDTVAAFANITMLSGGASFMAFFIFPEVSKEVMAYFVIASSILGVSGFAFASYRLKHHKKKALSPKTEEAIKLLDSDQTLLSGSRSPSRESRTSSVEA